MVNSSKKLGIVLMPAATDYTMQVLYCTSLMSVSQKLIHNETFSIGV